MSLIVFLYIYIHFGYIVIYCRMMTKKTTTKQNPQKKNKRQHDFVTNNTNKQNQKAQKHTIKFV